MRAEIEAIGLISGARAAPEDDFWGGTTALITLDTRFGEDALRGLDAFSHVEVLYLFHLVDPARVETGARRPRGNPDWPEVGIFAQRAKGRPNRLGSTICRLVQVKGRTLRVAELDAIEGTPVIDLKPVMAEFLPRDPVRQPDWSRALMSAYWASH